MSAELEACELEAEILSATIQLLEDANRRLEHDLADAHITIDELRIYKAMREEQDRVWAEANESRGGA